MVVQDGVERNKRRVSSSDSGKKERKRKRSSSTPKPVDEGLLRVLTGKDSPEPDSGVQNGGSLAGAGITTDAAKEGKTAEEPLTPSPTAIPAQWASALSESHAKKMKVTVLLEQANLETVKQSGRSGGVVLLNCEDHRHLLKKTGREANDARPDITHQCLLALMDSPLNKAGRLKVYIRTAKNVLIEVHPQTRVPRTIRRFSGLMAELLEKLKVRGTSGSTPLLRVIRNPITSHLPVGTRKIVCTYNSENVVDMREHAAKMAALVAPEKGTEEKMAKGENIQVDEDEEVVNVLYVIGAMAHGKVTEDWADEYICVSEYPLSAATVCSRLTYTFECLFGIL